MFVREIVSFCQSCDYTHVCYVKLIAYIQLYVYYNFFIGTVPGVCVCGHGCCLAGDFDWPSL